MPRYEVQVTYKLKRRITVHADNPAQAKAEAAAVVKAWQGTMEVTPGEAKAITGSDVHP
jgi:hypothetical protein